MLNKPINHRFCVLLSLLTVTLSVLPVGADEPQVGTERVLDARATGMVGALRSSAASTSALYLNPATMSMARLYHINLKYNYTGRDDLHNGGILLVDSITSSRFAAGVGVDYLRAADPGRDFESWDARLALSTGFADRFFIGMTGRYLRVENDLESNDRGPNGVPALPGAGVPQANGFTFDAGIAAKIGNVVGIGLVGYNLTNTESLYAPIQLGTGLSVNIMDIVHLESNSVFDFTSYDKTGYDFEFGAEFMIAGQFSLRSGYRHDFYFNINQISAGAGYNGQRLAVDFGYRQDIEYVDRFRLAFSLRIFVG